MSSYDAADVDLDPFGEILGDDVAEALHDLDGRRGWAHRIDDLQVAMTLTDDFMGNTNSSGAIGELGWATSSTAGGTVTNQVSSDSPGVIQLAASGSATARMTIDLGNRGVKYGPTPPSPNGASLRGCPVFVQECRCRLEAADTGTQKATVYVGLAADTAAVVAPGKGPTGCYFSYDAGKWWAVSATDPAARTVTEIAWPPPPVPLPSPPPPPETEWHRFRIISDGAGIVRYYVDDVRKATITTNVPLDTAIQHAPTIEIRKTLGTGARGLRVDYYTLRWEVGR